MATLESASMMRANLAFTGRSYQPLLIIFGLLLAAFVPRRTRKPTGLVGRSVALVALLSPQVPISGESFSASALLVPPSTQVLGSEPDYMDALEPRSIRHLTYPYKDSRAGGSTPSWSLITVA